MTRTTAAVRRGLVAALAAVAAAAGPLPQLAQADTAPAGEVTIPAGTQAGPGGDLISQAGATGYLAQADPGARTPDYVWHGFDGTVRDYGNLAAPRLLDDGRSPVLIGTFTSTGPLQIRDVASGSTADYPLPAGEKGLGVFPADSAAGWVGVSETPVAGGDGTTTGYALHLLTPGSDGTFTRDVVVGGQPASGLDSVSWKVVKGAAVIAYTTSGERRVGLLDTAGAALTWSTPAAVGQSGDLALGHGHLAYRVGSTVTVRAQADPATTLRAITVVGPTPSLALTGDALLTSPGASGIWTSAHEPLRAYPLDGSPATTLNGDAGTLLQSHDDGYLFDAATGDGGYATYRVGPDGGTPQPVRTYGTYQPRSIGLSLADGALYRVETVAGSQPSVAMRSYAVGAGPAPTAPGAASVTETGAMSSVATCGDAAPCMPLAQSDGSLVTLLQDASGHDALALGPQTGETIVSLPSSGGRVVSAGTHYVLYDSGTDGQQSLISTQHRKVVSTRPAVAAALWGDTLWSATATPGVFTAADAATGGGSRTVTTDAPCVPDEIQVLGAWLYWSCGANGPAGVWNASTGTSVRVGGGPALLGDGFVLRHDGGSLVLTDVHAGTAVDRTIAALPAGPYTDDRGITWTVDRFRGFIAYTDASRTTHVVAPGVPFSPLAVLASDVPDTADAADLWAVDWRLTGPALGWQVDVRRKGSDTIVASPSTAAGTGTSPQRYLSTSWNGHGADGRVLPDGAYTWTLTAPPSNRQGPSLVATGTVTLHGGAPDARDYTGDGAGDLLALTPGGSLDVRPGTGTAPGQIGATSASGTGWPSTSTLVQIGDLSGDGTPDLLARDATGHLTRYDGAEGRSFAASGPNHLIGAGWDVYDSLLSPGDLNGDGRPDLIARTPSGDLYFYAGNAAGVFAARVKIGFGYDVYSLMAGVQDLNGDGAGDVLARDTSGVLWRYEGDGKGGLKARVRIGAGWNVYNAIAGVGDINGDGRGDLVARDGNGDLWRYDGLGNGLFAPRVKIGWAWQTYKSLV